MFSAECTWHDNKRSTRTLARVHTIAQAHGGGHVLTDAKVYYPSLLSMLFAVRSPSLNVSLFLSRTKWTPINVPFSREGHVRPSKRSRSDQRTSRRTLFWPTSARPTRTIHLDPPVRSIGTTLKKRSRRSIVSNHDSSPPPPRASLSSVSLHRRRIPGGLPRDPRLRKNSR